MLYNIKTNERLCVFLCNFATVKSYTYIPMIKKLLLSLGLLVTSTVAFTTTPEALNVVRKNASISSAYLTNVRNITFDALSKTMNVLEKDDTEQYFSLPDIRKVMFGAYILSDDLPTIVDSIPERDNGVQKVLENGQVIIVRDGVRYNVLGMRLSN